MPKSNQKSSKSIPAFRTLMINFDNIALFRCNSFFTAKAVYSKEAFLLYG
jgi:hypothetical protein